MIGMELMIFDFSEPSELREPGLSATGPKMVCRDSCSITPTRY